MQDNEHVELKKVAQCMCCDMGTREYTTGHLPLATHQVIMS